MLVLGVGYENRLNNWCNIGLASGYGLGRADYSNFQDLMHNYSFSFKARKMELYIQPIATIHYEDYLDASVFSRITMNRYFNLSSDLELGDQTEPEPYDQFFIDRSIADLYFLEPGVQIRGGLKNLKLQLSCTRVIELGQTGIQYRPLNIFMGFSFKINLTNFKGVRFKHS